MTQSELKTKRDQLIQKRATAMSPAMAALIERDLMQIERELNTIRRVQEKQKARRNQTRIF